jgi:dTDP-6-deoxy-L-talose 4-dehydrogenase (NAD+)
LEYGLREGCLSEDMPVLPSNPYSLAKNELRLHVEELKNQFLFSFKWVRLFYMFGKGQNPGSLLSQLDKALQEGDKIFNMSGGEQTRTIYPLKKLLNI